jgi:phosphatidylinositol alpha-1,6-mannosyltransferase
MKLLIFSSEFPPGPGGIGTHAYQIALQLDQIGWQVLVLSTQDFASRAEIESFNSKQPFRVFHLKHLPHPILQAIQRSVYLYNSIRQWSPDVLLASGQRAVWLTAMLNKIQSIPWMAVGHGTEFAMYSAWENGLTKWSFNQATAIVTVSEYTRDRILDLGFRPKQVYVIPNGADKKIYDTLRLLANTNFRTEVGLTNDAYVLLTVGNITRRKGQDIIIRALPLIHGKYPNTHYLIVGMRTRQAELESLAKALGVEKYVHFTGIVDFNALVSAYNACDVFVMTSRHTRNGDFEGYGIAAVEAALCGKPAVVSRNSGLAEAVIDGVTGLHVSEDDPKDTAKAILNLLEDEQLRKRLGRSGQKRALGEQTWQECAHQYDEILRSLANNASSSSRIFEQDDIFAE